MKRPMSIQWNRPAKKKKTWRNWKNRGMVPTYRGFGGPRRYSMGEWKYVDVNTNHAANLIGSVVFLQPTLTTTGVSGRIGNKIAIRSLELRLRAAVTPGTGVDQIQRFTVVLDRQTNATGPTTLGQIYQAGSIMSPRNLENRKRFKFIVDKTFGLNASGESGSQRWFYFYIKFRKPVVVEYNNNAGSPSTVADIVSNSMHLFSSGSEAVGATAGTHYYYCRLRYTDF